MTSTIDIRKFVGGVIADLIDIRDDLRHRAALERAYPSAYEDEEEEVSLSVTEVNDLAQRLKVDIAALRYALNSELHSAVVQSEESAKLVAAGSAKPDRKPATKRGRVVEIA
jgi:hypothetical protein